MHIKHNAHNGAYILKYDIVMPAALLAIHKMEGTNANHLFLNIFLAIKYKNVQIAIPDNTLIKYPGNNVT